MDVRVPSLLASSPIKGIEAPCNKFFVPLTNIKSAYRNEGLYLYNVCKASAFKDKELYPVVLI